MAYQPKERSPKGAIHQYKKPFREKAKDKKRLARANPNQSLEEKHVATEKEISELTLRRLHTLGKQKFGSFPFGSYFDRWLANVIFVLNEFESNPNTGVDTQFKLEYLETIDEIKQQLEKIRLKEAAVNQEIKNLTEIKNSISQINTQYLAKINATRKQKNRQLKLLYGNIESLKKEEERVILLKTGFLHGISKKEREQKEMEIAQEISDKQREAELVMLDLKAVQKQFKEECERKKEPFLERQKNFSQKIDNLELDGSLEKRWFACEAIIDSVNTFQQRKASKSRNPPKADSAGIWLKSKN